MPGAMEFIKKTSHGITLVATQQRYLEDGARSIGLLERTPEGAFHLERARSLGTYATIWTDDEWVRTLGKPLTVNGFVTKDRPKALAIRGALLADPIKDALLIGHETVHSSMYLRGTAGSRAVNEGVAYSVEAQIAWELGRTDYMPPIARGRVVYRDVDVMPPDVVAARIRGGEQPYSLI